jgi:hypothetical protein
MVVICLRTPKTYKSGIFHGLKRKPIIWWSQIPNGFIFRGFDRSKACSILNRDQFGYIQSKF